MKIVWWWYLTLACVCFIPLACVAIQASDDGRIVFAISGATLAIAALPVGMALAVRRGRLGWATMPYAMVGLLTIMFGWADVLRHGLTQKNGLALFAAAALTVFPIALLHLPSSKAWFRRWPRPKRLGAGCGWLFGVFVVGFLVASIGYCRRVGDGISR